MEFSLFLFFSLAFAKRYAEPEMLMRANKAAATGRCHIATAIALIVAAATL